MVKIGYKLLRNTVQLLVSDKETKTWLQQNGYEIILAEVEEEYTPSIRTEDPYLQRYRVELDSVAQKLGPEGLNTSCIGKFLSKPNGLDYSNVIHKPASETLSSGSDILSDLQRYTDNITKTKWKEITTELGSVPELIDIQAKNTEIDESLSPIVAKDPGMQLIVKELKRLRELLKIKKNNYEDAGEINE